MSTGGFTPDSAPRAGHGSRTPSRPAGTLSPLVEAEGLQAAAHLGVYQTQLQDSLDCALHAVKLYRSAGDPVHVAGGLIELAYLQLHADDREAAQVTAAEAVTVAAQTDDLTLGSAYAVAAAAAADLATAKQIAAKAAPLLERAGDLRTLLGLWDTLGWFGLIEGALNEADQLFERALVLQKQTESPIDYAFTIGNRGHVAREQGDLDIAAIRYAATLALCRNHGLRKPVYETLAGLGAIAAAKGDATRAAQLAGACEATRFGHPLTPLDHRIHQAILAAKPQCAEAAWDEAYAAGAQLGLDAAIELGLKAASAFSETADQTGDPEPQR